MNWKIIKKHIMTGISFMVPVVVGAGLCQALGVILGGPNVKDAVGSFAYIIYKVGNLGDVHDDHSGHLRRDILFHRG